MEEEEAAGAANGAALRGDGAAGASGAVVVGGGRRRRRERPRDPPGLSGQLRGRAPSAGCPRSPCPGASLGAGCVLPAAPALPALSSGISLWGLSPARGPGAVPLSRGRVRPAALGAPFPRLAVRSAALGGLAAARQLLPRAGSTFPFLFRTSHFPHELFNCAFLRNRDVLLTFFFFFPFA